MGPINIRKSELLNFTMFLTGRSISVLMSSVYTFAIGLYVLKITGSGLSFAITLSLQILPTVLVGPFAGILADRLSKKVLVVLTDACSGILFIVLFMVSADGLTLTEIYIATLLLAVSQALYNVSIDSAVPDIVSEGNILRLNSIGKIIDSVSTIVSPGLGGILYATMNIRFFILLNGIAFFLSTLTECAINFNLAHTRGLPRAKLDLRRDLMEGIRYIWETGWIRSTLLNFLVVNFFFALCYSVPIPYILNSIFRLSSRDYGFVQCFSPAGMIIGALLAGRVTNRVPYGRLMTTTGVLCAVCLSLLGLLPALSPHPPLQLIQLYYAFLLSCSGLLIALIDIPFINNFQVRVPENIRGRAISISVSAVKVFTPMGYILSGSLTETVPAYYLPLYGGVLLFLFYIIVHIDTILAYLNQTKAK